MYVHTLLWTSFLLFLVFHTRNRFFINSAAQSRNLSMRQRAATRKILRVLNRNDRHVYLYTASHSSVRRTDRVGLDDSQTAD